MKPDIYRENDEDVWHWQFNRNIPLTTCKKEITSDWQTAILGNGKMDSGTVDPRRKQCCEICWKFIFTPAPYKNGRTSLYESKNHQKN